jgi:tetratricopeptide (TPR) repeat protein
MRQLIFALLASMIGGCGREPSVVTRRDEVVPKTSSGGNAQVAEEKSAEKRGNQMNAAADGNQEEFVRLYKEGVSLVKPYMILTDSPTRPVGTDQAQQDLSRGISLLKKAVVIQPDNWAAYWIIGKAYQALHDSENACDAFGKSFSIQDQNPDVAREYMMECLNLGRSDEGMRVAQHAVELRPTDAGLIANLALANLIAGKVGAALQRADESLRISPNDKITQALKKLIIEVRDGKRPQPKSARDLPEG